MRRKKDKSNGITALYERLSRDDDKAGESRMVKKVLYYAQVGIYVALAGLVLGCMLNNSI
jgi:predicted site-specific integrase-resolvase